MSIGGHSLHKKDYLQLAALAGSVTAPMWLPAVGGMLGAGGSAAATAADAMGVGLGAAPGESAVPILSALQTTAGGAAPAVNTMQKIGLLQQLATMNQQPQQQAVAQPVHAAPTTGDGMDILKRIYALQNFNTGGYSL